MLLVIKKSMFVEFANKNWLNWNKVNFYLFSSNLNRMKIKENKFIKVQFRMVEKYNFIEFNLSENFFEFSKLNKFLEEKVDKR